MTTTNSDSLHFPATLPHWMRAWVLSLTTPQGGDANREELRLSTGEIEVLVRLLADTDVASDLAKLDRAGQSSDIRERIKHFLWYTCMTYLRAQTKQAISPSAAREQLRVLADSTDRLAEAIHRNRQLVGVATSLRYLTSRSTTDNPAGFVLRERAGLQSARYTWNPRDLDLVQILEAFSADLKEELSIFPKRLDALDGGIGANIRLQIRSLKRAYQNSFGPANSEFIARILTVMNGEEVAGSRIRKTRV